MIKVKDFIFCDDVRTEIGRKFSIIGAYSDKFKITPGNTEQNKFRVFVSVFIKFYRDESEQDQTFDMKVEMFFAGEKLVEADGHIDFSTKRYVSIPVNRIELIVEKTEPFEFHILLKRKGSGEVALDHRESLQVVLENKTAPKQ